MPRRQLGRYLAELRERAGLTVKTAAKELERSTATLWRIESGKTSIRSHEVAVMCRVYGASEDLTEALTALAKETKARGWWHAYGDVIPEGFDLYIGLEEAAARLDVYETALVPGLLQSEGYARSIIEAGHADKDPAEVERRVQLRVKRRVLLTRVINPPKIDVALYEAVLRCPVGGHKTMAEQLRYLAEASELPNLTIKVVPFSAGLHQGVVSGQFMILRFPSTGNGSTTEPPTVYVDGYTGALYLDKPAEIEQYDSAFRNVWNMALGVEESRRLILEVAGSLDG
ncbi:helix-turn-helix domain-containing protein [Streptomyces gamaensis]|uniref:Helix-turn-helix domain-containing protein n=1 Tax=Streptomyces gamaensis TaxID=1763542 RepID=A0ABW0YYZ8_9ACTN